MRRLTRAEAIVILSLLASEELPKRELIRRSGLPSRTFEVARKRVLAAGWVQERYIPNLVLLGRPMLSVVLAHPYAECLRDVVNRWKVIDGNALLWRGGTSVLGVFCRSPLKPALKLSGELGETEIFSRLRALEIDTRVSAVPAYFDFQGAWSRVVGGLNPVGYPHSLPDRIGWPNPVREASQSELRLIETTTRSAIYASRGSEHVEPSQSGLRRDEVTRALDNRLVTLRAFLGLGSLPGYRLWELRQIVFLTGHLRRPAQDWMILEELKRRAGLTPFLFVSDGVDVLLALLSPNPDAQDLAIGINAKSVVEALNEFFSSIHVTREPTSDFALLVDHRYDRLLPQSVVRT
jgi:predicted transcriptional regulator